MYNVDLVHVLYTFSVMYKIKYVYQVVICYYNCSDIVKCPREEQEYCYICRFVVKLCIVRWIRKNSLIPMS